MKIAKYNYFLLVVPFAVMAFLSAVGYPRMLQGNCFFQTNWLSCASSLGGSQKIGLILLVSAIFTSLVVAGYSVSKTPIVFTWKKAILLLTLAVLIEPFGSGDISYYFNAGNALALGQNVYVGTWKQGETYLRTASPGATQGFQYGPIAARAFEAAYLISGKNIYIFTLLWKIISAVALVLVAVLVSMIVRSFKPEIAAKDVYAMVIFQPLLLFEWVSNGHFDAWWLLGILAAILFCWQKRWWLAVVSLCAGVWIKFVPIITIPFFALWWWQETRKDNWKKMVWQLVLGLFVSVLITVVAWSGLWQGSQVFGGLVLQSKWAAQSLFSAVYFSLQPLARNILGSGFHYWFTRIVQGSLLVGSAVLLLPQIIGSIKVLFKKMTWEPKQYLETIFLVMTGFLLVWQKSVWPWYLAWPLIIGIILKFLGGDDRISRWIASVPLVFYPLWFIDWQLRAIDASTELWFWWATVMLFIAYPVYIITKTNLIKFVKSI